MLVKDKIALERQRKGISATELADLVGLTKATISRYESGAIQLIPTSSLKRIVDVLDCDFDSFVSDDPKYCMLSSEPIDEISYSLSKSEQKQLIKWYENLPPELQTIVKQLWKIPIKT